MGNGEQGMGRIGEQQAGKCPNTCGYCYIKNARRKPHQKQQLSCRLFAVAMVGELSGER